MTTLEKASSIVIVGAGCFGLSTAYELAQTYPKLQITIIDEHQPPVPLAASNDTSRIVRADYGDERYAKLGQKAIRKWLEDPKLRHCFHQSGVICCADDPTHPGFNRTRDTMHRLGEPIQQASNYGGLRPDSSYLNTNAGSVNAELAIRVTFDRLMGYKNVKFVQAKVERVDESSITYSDTTLEPDLIILACGAWSASLAGAHLKTQVLATGQCMAYIRVDEAESLKLQQLPVLLNYPMASSSYRPHPRSIHTSRLRATQQDISTPMPMASAAPATFFRSHYHQQPSPVYDQIWRASCLTIAMHRLTQFESATTPKHPPLTF